MGATADKPILSVETVAEWEGFLEGTTDNDGVRLRLRKTATTQPGITYAEALDSALCFGWIDGQRNALDDYSHLQVFTPRRPRSVWSQRNRELVERLIAEGRMRPAGQTQVDGAKADGRWEVAYRQKGAEAPPDLRVALDASPIASALFAQLSSQNRFAIVFSSVQRQAGRHASQEGRGVCRDARTRGDPSPAKARRLAAPKSVATSAPQDGPLVTAARAR